MLAQNDILVNLVVIIIQEVMVVGLLSCNL